MPNQIPEDILRMARKIPAPVLKTKTGSKGRKEDLIIELYKKDPELLRQLADYHDAMSNQFSGFVFKIPKKPIIDLTSAKALDSINSLLNGKIINEESRIEIESLSIQEYGPMLHIRYETNPHIDRLWNGDKHEHKKVLHAVVSLKFTSGCATFRGRGRENATICMKKISEIVFGGSEKVEIIVPTLSDQEKKFGEILPKKVTITNIKLPGTEKMTLYGEDVGKTIEVLKDTYGLDFESSGSDIQFQKTETTEQVRFRNDGSIVIPSRASKSEEIIKRLLK
jgi:hypothetical protein